jgi:hypothetical protein
MGIKAFRSVLRYVLDFGVIYSTFVNTDKTGAVIGSSLSLFLFLSCSR